MHKPAKTLFEDGHPFALATVTMLKLLIVLSILSPQLFAVPAEPVIWFGFTDLNGHYILILKGQKIMWGDLTEVTELTIKDLIQSDKNPHQAQIFYHDVRIPKSGFGQLTLTGRSIIAHHGFKESVEFYALDDMTLRAIQKMLDHNTIEIHEAGLPGQDRPAESAFKVGDVIYYVRYHSDSDNRVHYLFSKSSGGSKFQPINPAKLGDLNLDLLVTLPYANNKSVDLEIGFDRTSRLGVPFSCKRATASTGESLSATQLDITSPEFEALDPPLLKKQYTPYDLFLPNCERALDPGTSSGRH